MEIQDNYTKQLEKWRKEFAQNGKEIVLKHSAYPVKEERYLTLSYFQKEYTLDLKTGMLTNKGFSTIDLDAMSQMMIYSHLSCFKTGAIPSGKMVSLSDIKEAAVFDAAFRRRTGKELVDSLRGHFSEYEKIVQEYGGKIEQAGDFSVSFYAVLDLKITYIFWLGDEEFDSSIRVLFDSNICRYVHPEAVVILGGHGMSLLEELAVPFMKEWSAK